MPKIFLSIILLFALSIYPVQLLHAQEEEFPEDFEDVMEEVMFADSFSGIVDLVDPSLGIITVKEDESAAAQSYKISEYCYVLIDDMDGTIQEIKPGDQIYLEFYMEAGENHTDWIEIMREAPAVAPAVE